MARGDRSGSRGVLRLGVAAALFAGAVSAACITAIPDLVVPPLTPPTIDHGAVQPPEGALSSWPDHFTIPVRVTTPGETFSSEFVYDFMAPSQEVRYLTSGQPAPDGGVALLVEGPTAPLDQSVCPHSIDFVVGHTLVAPHVPDSIGGDFVHWEYWNGAPNGCAPFDAGTGLLPPADASTDAVIVIGGGDP